ncbi:PAS domain-containing protein [Flavobacterium sp.]
MKSLIEVSNTEFQSYDFNRSKVIFTSGLIQKLLGYSQEEFSTLSENFYEMIIHPDDRQMMYQNIDEIIESSEREIIEMTARYKKANGTYLLIYTRKIVTQRDERGRPITITTIAEDITELSRIENKLKEKSAQLEAISWKNSHLLRSPVANIIGLIDMIEIDEITSKNNLKVFKYMKEVIKTLDTIIHEINNISTKDDK